jgi:hypothetical protein
MSTSLLPGLLQKRHLEKDEEAACSSDGVDPSLSAALSSEQDAPAFPTREQCASVAQLLQYVHSLVVCTLRCSFSAPSILH